MTLGLSDEERELYERNVRSLTALFESMDRRATEFIRHVSESMAMSTAAHRETKRFLREVLDDVRKEKRERRSK